MRIFLFLFLSLFSLYTSAQNPQQRKNVIKALELYNSGKVEKGINTIKKEINKDRQFFLGYYALEAIFLNLEDYNSLRQNYNEAIAWMPKNGYFYFKRGYLNLNDSRPKEAINDLNSAYELIQNDSLIFLVLKARGGAKGLINDSEGAYNDYYACYKFDSTDVEVINNLAASLGELGKHEEAIKYLFKVVEMDPTKHYSYLNIGFQYQYLNQHDKAIEYFDKTIQIDPKMAYAYSNRSFSKLQLGDIEGAKKDIEISINLDPTNSYAYRNKAHIFLKEGNISGACEQLQIALKKGFTTQYGLEVKNLSNEHCK